MQKTRSEIEVCIFNRGAFIFVVQWNSTCGKSILCFVIAYFAQMGIRSLAGTAFRIQIPFELGCVGVILTSSP